MGGLGQVQTPWEDSDGQSPPFSNIHPRYARRDITDSSALRLKTVVHTEALGYRERQLIGSLLASRKVS